MTVISAVLLNALREYNFVGSPLWRLSDGKDLVRVELTFHKNQPTTRYYKKRGGGGRKQEAACTLCWRVASPAHTCDETDDDDQIEACTPTADTGEGNATISRRDTADHSTYHHQTSTPATDSRDHAITNHHETSYTVSFARIATVEKAKDQVTGDEHCTNPVLSRQHRGRIPYPLHEKYELLDVTSTKYKAIVRAATLQKEDEEYNVDLPAYFVYHRDTRQGTNIQVPR